MKSLKAILFIVYVIIILLLLLSFKDCSKRPAVDPQPNARIDTAYKKSIIKDTIREEPIRNDSIAEKVPIKEKFKADVVMCIDCTNSMNNIINTIKSNALSLSGDIKRKCREQGKDVTSMRIKVIGFRDFSDLMAFESSPFYNMHNQESAFKNFISNMAVIGGGDIPERAYEALGLAIQSEWDKAKDVHQVVILWTDAESHPLLGTVNVEQSVANLHSLWKSKLNAKARRMILFAPDVPCWALLERKLDNTVRYDVSSGGGLSEVDYDEILKTLSETM